MPTVKTISRISHNTLLLISSLSISPVSLFRIEIPVSPLRYQVERHAAVSHGIMSSILLRSDRKGFRGKKKQKTTSEGKFRETGRERAERKGYTEAKDV